MNIDYFLRGSKSHKICEDYVKCGKNRGYEYMFISDGCSSSLDTDVGSRILVHSAISILHERGFISYNDFQFNVIFKAQAIISNLHINRICLDATLLSVIKMKDLIVVNVFGDGNVILVDKDDKIHLHSFNYKNEAPFYLNYKLDFDREDVYCEQNSKFARLHIYNGEETIEYIYDPLQWSLNMNEYKFICIASDGLKSFVNKETGEFVKLGDVVNGILQFKNFNGAFLQRRMNRIFSEYEKQNIYNYDDVSIAVMSLV